MCIVRAREALLPQLAQSLRAVPREGDGDRECIQRLVCADVARRFLTPDVLLPGLQSEDECALAVTVDGLTNESPGQSAHVGRATGHDAGVGAAEI